MNKPAASGDIAAETALSLARRAREARRLVRRRAALSAAAAVLPIPGLDIAVDLAAFADMLNQINRSFALSQVGAVFAGRYVTNAVVLTAVKQLGARWAAGRAAKWVPIAGQGAAAALSFWAVVRLGDAHIAECLRVREQVRALLTAPSSSEIP
ncbi:hypothetical protein [Sutterella wadsworthensis]|uniref:hypothetical protein n=1 Tax=Sutterella wadsworthensis TaxID=40545 RepID=UPI0013F61475|nr:hypothetical protein [Sutterella wadsworthensis]